jgi:hypothetical protein
LPVAQACTLFAAAGSSVQGGGTIIAKNRDRCPLASGLKVFVPQHGYRHLGLVSLADAECRQSLVREKILSLIGGLPQSMARSR